MKKQNGITLIALIITIIVMLILVAVTISVALNGGLFNNAKDASDKTQRQAEKEELISAMVGAYNSTGNFATSNVGTLPGGARWCTETDENWADVNPDNQPTNWIITKNNNKFYIDASGSVLDEKTGDNSELNSKNSIYDVAYIDEDEEWAYVFKNNGGTVTMYSLYYSNGTLDTAESESHIVSIGSKVNYQSEILEDYFPGADFDTEIRNEVIVDDGDIWIAFKLTENQEILNDGKGEYIRNDNFTISGIDFSSIN